MILHFYSSVPLTMEINNNFYDILNTKCLEIESFNNLFVKVFFYNQNFQNYVFCLKNRNNTLISNNNFVRIFKIKENEFFALITPVVKDNSILHSSKDLTIKNGTSVYYNKEIIYSENFCAINYTTFSFCGLPFFVLNGEEENLLLIINKENILLKTKFSKIEYDENSFTVLTEMNDSFNHALVKQFEVLNDGLSLTNEYSVYMSAPPSIFNKNLVVHNFLECGKALNLNLAKSFLGGSLKNNFTIENFKSFFGNFNLFYVYNHTQTSSNCICVYENHFKNFHFILENDKIINIT